MTTVKMKTQEFKQSVIKRLV